MRSLNETRVSTLLLVVIAATLLGVAPRLAAQDKPRARDLGIVLPGQPGAHNAITDVAGVAVGHATLISGSGRLEVGKGPVRTGVTAILPRGQSGPDSVFAAWYSLNGNGEMTGIAWLEESGILGTPLVITNTHSVGVARDAVIEWMLSHRSGFSFALPVVTETADGFLSDMNGFHVRPAHVFEALDAAAGGPVAEGNVGGGTGMMCHALKGGIGTASRVLQAGRGGYTVGVLVQCNYGQRQRLRVDGVPVGEELRNDALWPCTEMEPDSLPENRRWIRSCGDRQAPGDTPQSGQGSIIIVVATDAPLLPHQLKRLTRRASLAVGRMGGLGENSSGDIFLAFSTANAAIGEIAEPVNIVMLPNDQMNDLFEATVQATEEAILNALVAAETMTGANGIRVYALPHDQLTEIMARHGRLRR